MLPFNHEYAASHRFRWVERNGEAELQALIVVPNIPTDPGAPNFDKRKLDALANAATKYFRSQNRNCMVEIEA